MPHGSTDRRDDAVADLCAGLGAPVFRGPEDDVLGRYILAAEASRADAVVRLTADCPLICPEVSDKVVRAFLNAASDVDYASNTLRRTYPRGLDTEIVGTNLLRSAAGEAVFGADREHVTRFIWRQPERFRLIGVEDLSDNSDLRWTVDQGADLEAVRRAVAHLGPRAVAATYGELLEAFRAHPEWIALNRIVEQERA
jgi:spore coat polysaccharide biosynthesis protein SpsF